MASYILVDTTLIGYPEEKPWLKQRRKPGWIATLYQREALSVSPILIDIERAWQCGRIDSMMVLVNAEFPQLGISFIETRLSLTELQAHFRQFIYILTAQGEELTLRFADCIVLSTLAAVLNDEQWGALVEPLDSWKAHDRDGKLKPIPIIRSESRSGLPLLLSDEQICALKEASGADELLANLRKMRPGRDSEYATFQAHQCAEQIRQVWRSAGYKESTDLLLFARDVFESEGRLLLHPALPQVLAQPDQNLRRIDLRRLGQQLGKRAI